MSQEHFLLAEVARKVSKKPHQIAYMLTNGVIEEPQLRIGGRRVFTRQEVEVIQKIVRGKRDRTGKEEV